MNRGVTNAIRWMMDNCLPPLVRDNYYFMYPFYWYWFAGSKEISSIIRFKEIVHGMSETEFTSFYESVHCRSSSRPTDCSEESLDWVLGKMRNDPEATTLLDVGCGRGYCLQKFSGLGLSVTGCDVSQQFPDSTAQFKEGSVEHLPFEDDSFDIVTCFHTLEHVRDLPRAIAELKRVARRHLFLIVPCQRYFRYTLDLHVHFFYSASYFSSFVQIENSRSEIVFGDIVYHGEVRQNLAVNAIGELPR